MSQILPYHIQKDQIVLSLKFVNPSYERAREVEQDLRDAASDSANVFTELKSYSFRRDLYAVYSAETYPRNFPSGFESELAADDVIIVDVVLDIFRGVSDSWREKNEPLEWYKRPEPTEIAHALNKVEWRQDVPKVGGELMSHLILRHSMPNANHRTAIGILQIYLKSMSPEIEVPTAGNFQGDWFDWAEKYVYESKRLLTFRRKPSLLNHLKQSGCPAIQRKSDIKIKLSEYDFTSDDLKQQAEREHRQRSIEFVEEYLRRTSKPELMNERDPGKEVFVDRLYSD